MEQNTYAEIIFRVVRGPECVSVPAGDNSCNNC